MPLLTNLSSVSLRVRVLVETLHSLKALRLQTKHVSVGGFGGHVGIRLRTFVCLQKLACC